MATVGTEWIQDFHPPPGCNQNQLSWCAAGSQGFGSAMLNRGHTWNFDWGDDNAWETDWRDPSNGGDSSNTQGGCNSVNFTYLSTHGGPIKDGAGNDIGFLACFSAQHQRCNWSNTTSILGQSVQRWTVMDTCEALDLPSPWVEWWPCYFGLHEVFGFTGTSSDAWWTHWRGSDFGDAAGRGSVLSSSWLGAAYSFWLGDHPVAMSCGVNQADGMNRLFNETVFSGFPDLAHNQIGWFHWTWRS